MAFELDLPREDEEMLRAAAVRRGQSPQELARELVIEGLPGAAQAPLSKEEEERLLDELAVLSDGAEPDSGSETYSREMIYSEHA